MHDFPGYALFHGWCTSGKMPCPVCMHALIFIKKFFCRCRSYVNLGKYQEWCKSSTNSCINTLKFFPGYSGPEIISDRNMVLRCIMAPGGRLSVFMQSLVDDLHHSWYFPRLTYDRHLQKNFLMKVWLQYCMHDFPGYALFCGWCTSGKMPCPVCMQALICLL